MRNLAKVLCSNLTKSERNLLRLVLAEQSAELLHELGLRKTKTRREKVVVEFDLTEELLLAWTDSLAEEKTA